MNEDVKRYLVIVIDRKKGKYFTIYGDAFEDEGEEILDDNVPQHIKAEHTRPGKVQRHINDHLRKHFKHVGQKAHTYFLKQPKHIDGVLIGGHREHLSLIKEYLPSPLNDTVVAVFIATTALSIGEVTDKAVKALKQ